MAAEADATRKMPTELALAASSRSML